MLPSLKINIYSTIVTGLTPTRLEQKNGCEKQKTQLETSLTQNMNRRHSRHGDHRFQMPVIWSNSTNWFEDTTFVKCSSFIKHTRYDSATLPCRVLRPRQGTQQATDDRGLSGLMVFHHFEGHLHIPTCPYENCSPVITQCFNEIMSTLN